MGADVKEENASGFEGFEKRLEVEFEEVVNDKGSQSSNAGLRALSRCELDEMLTAAECTIVSERHNSWFDAYVLSESSLFVYPCRLVLKTCGKTQLLNAIPVLLRHATSLSLKAVRCKYSRGTFIFPDAQPFPYTSFAEETCVLDEHFAPMILHGCRSAHVLAGHPVSNSSSWHIYTASSAKEYAPATLAAEDPIEAFPNMSTVAGKYVEAFPYIVEVGDSGENSLFSSKQSPSSVYTLEMCMTNLDSSTSSHFMNFSGSKSGADMTHVSGISSLLPNADICDFAFSPCGYSMNGMEEDALSTIHVTPEEGHSYASFEVMGYDPHSLKLEALVNRAVACFKPGSLVMSIHASGYGKSKPQRMSFSWDTSSVVPRGYVCNSSVRQELAGGGVVVFHTFTKGPSAGRCSVLPQPLRSHGGHANRGEIDTSYHDGLVLPCSQQNGMCNALLQFGDTALEMAAKENNAQQAERACCACDSYTENGSDRVEYAHGALETHLPLLNSYRSTKYCGAMLSIVESEMEIFRLRECYPYGKVLLRLGPKSTPGSCMELSGNSEETKLGLVVIGIAVDTGIEPRLMVCAYKGAIRKAIKMCRSAQALGLPPLKMLHRYTVLQAMALGITCSSLCHNDF